MNGYFKDSLKVKNISNETCILYVGNTAIKFLPYEIKEVSLDFIYMRTDGSGKLRVDHPLLKVIEGFADLYQEPVLSRFEILDL